jgi:hypothetical protein
MVQFMAVTIGQSTPVVNRAQDPFDGEKIRHMWRRSTGMRGGLPRFYNSVV